MKYKLIIIRQVGRRAQLPHDGGQYVEQLVLEVAGGEAVGAAQPAQRALHALAQPSHTR